MRKKKYNFFKWNFNQFFVLTSSSSLNELEITVSSPKYCSILLFIWLVFLLKVLSLYISYFLRCFLILFIFRSRLFIIKEDSLLSPYNFSRFWFLYTYDFDNFSIVWMFSLILNSLKLPFCKSRSNPELPKKRILQWYIL